MACRPSIIIAAFVAAILLVGCPAAAQVLPQLDRPDGFRKGIPDQRSFGTLVTPLQLGDSEADRPAASHGELPKTDRLMDAYLLALEGRQYPQAIQLAEQMVIEAERQYGQEHLKYGLLLSDLGAALHHAGEHDRALQPLRRSARIVSREAGLFHPDLIGIYAYLGMALQAAGDHREGLDYLSRAQSLIHRESGARDPAQIKLLYAKAHSLEALGETWQAEQMFRAALKISRDHYGETSLEALPAAYRLAVWLRESGRYRPALSLYRETLELLVDAGGDDTPAMVPAMRGMAMTYLLEQAFEVDRGLSLQRRIVALTERFPHQFSLHDRIAAHLDYGDWLLMFHREEDAWEQYARAWSLTREDGSRVVDWDRYFAEPRLIYGGPPVSLDVMGYQVVGKEQWNDFEFRIQPDGRPTHVRILDSNMHATTRRISMRLLREGRFRPAMPGGVPVAIADHRMRRVYPTDPPPDFGVVDVGGEVLGSAR